MMQEVRRHFEGGGSDTLAIFDIDMVLIQPDDPAFQMANMKHHSTLAKKIMNRVPEEKRVIFLTLMTFNSGFVLVDPNTPLFLQELQDKNIPAIALTANLTGSLAHVPNVESWKSRQLAQVGIDFSKGVLCEGSIVFDNLPPFRGNYCMYKNGILFTNGHSSTKGDLLVNFLQRIEYRPKKIVFIDDREENLASVETSLRLYNSEIQYVSVHYLAAKDYPSLIIDENEFEKRWEAIASQTKLVN